MKRRKIQILVIVGLIVGIHVSWGYAQTPVTGEVEEAEKPQRRRVVYNDFKSEFKELCEHVSDDGRGEAFEMLLISQIDTGSACVACKTFFYTFGAACRGGGDGFKKKKNAHGHNSKSSQGSEIAGAPEEVTSPVPSASPQACQRPQLEPSIFVIDGISQLFIQLSEDSRRDDTYLAVARLVAVLRKPEGKSEDEGNYFSVMAEYIAAPFEEYAADIAKRGARTVNPGWLKPAGDVNDLF